MLAIKYVLWIITAVSGVTAAAANTCSRDLKPQPIGIDFGSNMIIATYAHTSKNITTISWLAPPAYQPIIFRLRLEDYEAQQTAKILWGVNKKRDQIIQALKDTCRAHLSPILTPLSTKLTALKTQHPILRDVISWLSLKCSSVLTFVQSKLTGKSWFNDDLTMQDVKNAFISVLNETKITAAATSTDPEKQKFNTNISFAIFSVPDFFNKTLCDLVIEAAKEVGIESLPITIARTVAAGIGAQSRELLAEDNDGVATYYRVSREISKSRNLIWDAKGLKEIGAKHPEPTSTAINLPAIRPEKILIVDQSRFYAALRTYEVEDRSVGGRRALALSHANERRNGKLDEDGGGGGGEFLQRYLPLDPYGSQIMDTQLYQRVLGREMALKEEIGWGADQERLRDEVARARLMIKDSLDREVGMVRKSGEAGRGPEEEEDRHHEEWPLNLNGWSSSGRDLQITLKWEDVATVEQTFVDKFAEAIHMFLVTLRRIRISNDQTTHPETIHTVVIVTDHTDGQLLTRAVTQALGKDIKIKIVGGSLASATLAAEGAAKLALRRLDSWKEIVRQERLLEFLDSKRKEKERKGEL